MIKPLQEKVGELIRGITEVKMVISDIDARASDMLQNCEVIEAQIQKILTWMEGKGGD